ncbi:11356_t:CDS:1, partial [Gigaspora margarita]
DAAVNGKEMWLLSQDISKAYNSIHIPVLRKALERIRVPDSLTNLIVNIFLERKNAIITNLRIIDTYEVEDSIDQREMMAPLLW